MGKFSSTVYCELLGKAQNLRLIFLSAKRPLASRSSWDAEFAPVPSLISEVEWYAMPLVYSTVFSQKVIMKQADLVTLHNHKFLFLFSIVCPNESLPLGSCGPRRCIIGLSIPAYPSGKCIAVVGLYPTQFGNEGYRLGTSCSEYSADGTKLLTPSTSTNGYGMVLSLKLKYTAEASTNGYGMVLSLKLKYTAEAITNGYGMGPSLQ